MARAVIRAFLLFFFCFERPTESEEACGDSTALLEESKSHSTFLPFAFCFCLEKLLSQLAKLISVAVRYLERREHFLEI